MTEPAFFSMQVETPIQEIPPLSRVNPRELSDDEAFDYLLKGLDESYMRRVRKYRKRDRRIGPRASAISVCQQKMLLEIIHADKKPLSSDETCKSYMGGALGHDMAAADLAVWSAEWGFALEKDKREEPLDIFDHDGTLLCTGHSDYQLNDGVHSYVVEVKTASTLRVRELWSVEAFTRFWERGYRAQSLMYLTAKKGGYWINYTLEFAEGRKRDGLLCGSDGTEAAVWDRCVACGVVLPLTFQALRLLGSHELECEACGLKRGHEKMFFFITDCRGQRAFLPITLDQENRAYIRELMDGFRAIVEAQKIIQGGGEAHCALTTDPSECRWCWLKDQGVCHGINAEIAGTPILTDEAVLEKLDRMADLQDAGEEYATLKKEMDGFLKDAYRDSMIAHVIAGPHTVTFKRMRQTGHEFPADVKKRHDEENKKYAVTVESGRIQLTYTLIAPGQKESNVA